MNITVKISNASLKDLDSLLERLAEIGVALRKKHPDIVVNAEVEME